MSDKAEAAEAVLAVAAADAAEATDISLPTPTWPARYEYRFLGSKGSQDALDKLSKIVSELTAAKRPWDIYECTWSPQNVISCVLRRPV